jgi:membrane protein DedA with SNARE-associated domain
VDLIISLMEYAQSRYSLVLLMVFLLTFTKSCAVISLLIPGTSGLLLFGTLASASVGHFLLMWMSASLGAIGGFWLSWLTGAATGTICIVSAGLMPNAWLAASCFCAATARGRSLAAFSPAARHRAAGHRRQRALSGVSAR